MKGQYLAVETVFVFGLGLIAAIGVITLFNQFKIGVLDDAEPKQAEIITSEMENTFRVLTHADTPTNYSRATVNVELPNRLAGRDYDIEVSDRKLVLSADGDSYSESLDGFSNYTFSGSATGGDVTVFKQGNQFTVRAQ